MSTDNKHETLNFTLRVWRQKDQTDKGCFVDYQATSIDEHMSFLEMLDVINEELTLKGEEPIAFDHDCREGICGSCGAMVNGVAHGPVNKITLCQLHMRSFKGVSRIVVEPFRATALPVVKDLVINRTALDRVIASGGYISVKTGSAGEANQIQIEKDVADKAFDAAQCIGCAACVAACPNASASLFVGAKVSHLNSLPQGQAEAKGRVMKMIETMDQEGFGSCTNAYQCEAACPKGISVSNIAKMNREYLKAKALTL